MPDVPVHLNKPKSLGGTIFFRLGWMWLTRENSVKEADTTDDHETIRAWAEKRRGRPSRAKGAINGEILRIDFGERDETLEPISWEEFFTIFDHNKLLFLHQDRTADGKISRFNKFIDRP
ncbi:hypothetical protein [Ensifer sp. NM-2]|jgi:hypothetical protein|uniref:hypothetical protein n=1 Tax=Ensifer sp. NM-2 TaxID=2109730 RepID=UPI00352A6070